MDWGRSMALRFLQNRSVRNRCGRRAVISSVAVAVAFVIACNGGGGPDQRPPTEAWSHVKVAACKAGKFGSWQADLLIRNPNNEKARYEIRVTVFRAGTQQSQGSAPLNINVKPLATIKRSANGYRKDHNARITCRVTKAIRYSLG